MTGAQWFVLDLNPAPWEVGPLGVVRREGRVRPYMGKNQQLDDYKKAVRSAVLAQDPVKLSGKVRLTCIFWRNIAEYSTPQSRVARNHEADTTNMLKATEDALQGVLYDNDKDNNETHGYTAAQGPGIKPRIVICVEQGDDIPDIINHLPAHVYDAMDRLNRPELFETQDWYVDGDGDPSRLF